MANSTRKILGWAGALATALLIGVLLSSPDQSPLILVFGQRALSWLTSVAVSTWSLVTWDTNLPLGILVLCMVAAVWLGAWLATAGSSPEIESPSAKRGADRLTDAEIAVLKILAKQGTAWHSFRDIEIQGAMSDLLLEKSLNGLMDETDLLFTKRDPLHGFRVRLSDSGADLALSRGWASNQVRNF